MLNALAALLAMIGGPTSDYREQYPLPGPTIPEGWGVNVHMRQAEMKEYDMLRDLGVRWARLDLLWSRIERKQGEYDFSDYDRMIRRLRERGVRPLIILDYGNKLYDVDSPRTREGRDAFAAFARAAVERYRGIGAIWEIWNEPNLIRYWKQPPSAEEYAALVRVTGEAIRSVGRDEWIAGPAISRFDWPFLERTFERGALQYLDAVTVHPYRDNKEPESVLAEWKRLRALVDKHAPNGKKIALISGEWGYSTHTKGVSSETQAQFAIRQYLTNLSAGVGMSIWYSWQDRGDDAGLKEHNYGLITTGGEAKPAYRLIQAFIHKLDGYSLETAIDFSSPTAHGLLVRKGTERRLLAWTSGKKEEEVVLPAAVGQFSLPGGSPVRNRILKLRPSVQILEQRW